MIYLALVGEQPMPVLLPLWQEKGFTSVQLIASETTRPVAEFLADFICSDPAMGVRKVHPVMVVDAYDLEKASVDLNDLLAKHRYHRAVFNLTGGTKMMSIAAQQAAAGTHACLLYVSTEKRSLIYFSPNSKGMQTIPIQVKVTVEQYFNAHGFECSESQNFGLRECEVPPPKEGDALEDRVYDLLCQSGLFDDVRRNVFIRRTHGSSEVTNELDVVASSGGNLVVCSCKSGKVDNQALYELASLSRREVAGIYCGRVLVSSKKTLLPGVVNRAAQDGIRVITAGELEHAARIAYETIL